MSGVIAIIPARFESSRYPAKMLASETGKPLIQHTYEQACRAKMVDRVLIATDHEGIADAVRAFGGDVTMTRADHPNGTSRIAEAATDLDVSLVVNVQGDEPELDPALIDQAVMTLRDHEDCVISTMASPFISDEDAANPNVVKVVCNRNGHAMYFSRACIPHDRDQTGEASILKHVGLYVYRATFLPTYASLTPTPLESIECLEQLRVLEHGYSICVGIGAAAQPGIDTPEQYADFVRRYQQPDGGG